MSAPLHSDVVQVETKGRVGSRTVEYAQQKVEAVLRYARDPVLHVRARVTRLDDPAVARPWVAEVNLDLNGRLVRVQVARPTMVEAVDEMHDRLRERVVRSDRDWEAIRGARSQADQWRHDSAPADRPPYFPRPEEERQVFRRTSFTPRRLSVDEAVLDLDLLDYAFLLFTEAGSGIDSVLYLDAEEPGYRLCQVDPRPDRVQLGQTRVVIDQPAAPVLTVEEAIERLNLTGWPFVLFRDPETRRGCVLYHRYDGHYGLLEPAA